MIRRILSLALTALLCVGLFPVTAFAAPETGGSLGEDLAWEFQEDTGTLWIRGEGAIPDFDGVGLTPWCQAGYADSIQYIKLHSGPLRTEITRIGNYALSGLPNLVGITIPSGISEIGNGAFADCTSFSRIILPETLVSIGSNAFSGTQLSTSRTLDSKYIMFTGDVPNIESTQGTFTPPLDMDIQIFYPVNNATWTEEAKQRIGGDLIWVCFDQSTGALSIDRRGDISLFINSPFWGPDDVKSIYFSAKVTDINRAVLSSLIGKTTEFIVDQNNPYLQSVDGVLFTKDMKTLIAYPSSKADSSYVVPNGVTHIDDFAFSHTTQLKNITLPDSLLTVGEHTFPPSLSHIVIPANLTGFGFTSFRDCENLHTIGPVGGNYDIQFCWDDCIPDQAFMSYDLAMPNYSLSSAVIPGTFRSIGKDAFYRCAGLKTVTFEPRSNTTTPSAESDYIGEKAFYGCSSLEEIVIPEGYTTIQTGAFQGCTSLKKVTLPSTITSIWDKAFDDCPNLEEIVFQGTDEQWYNIAIASDNTGLFSVKPLVLFLLQFDTNGGSTIYSKAVSPGKAFSVEEYVPVKYGYVFDGWYADQALTKAISFITLYADTTIYAKWRPAKYTLTFDSNGGSAMDPVSVTNAVSVNLNNYIPTRTGYQFGGWYSDKALTTPVTKITLDKNITLYAKWTPAKYTLTFDTNGGSTISPVSVMDPATIDLSKYLPTKTGYQFDGWYSNKALTTPVSKITLDKNITLYAKWTPAKYTLTFDTNGGSTISPVSVSEPATIDLSKYLPTKTGYQFDGWYSDKALTTPVSKITLTGSATVYAKWIQQEVPVKAQFSDVREGEWYYDDVQYVFAHGLMQGVGPNAFDPEGTTTRGMIVTILYRQAGAPTVSTAAGFADVEPGTWYADAVDWAAANGVVTGTSSTTFAPNAPVTREQMATILYRYAALMGYPVTASADLSRFSDAAQISDYARGPMAWATAAGLINGVSANQLDPKGQASRCQIAAILHRFCTLLEG